MEGHTAFPDPQHAQGVGEELIEAIEEHVPQASPQDGPDDSVEDPIVHHSDIPPGTGPRSAVTTEYPCGGKTHQVHESVPVDLERPEGQGDRIELRIAQHPDLLPIVTYKSLVVVIFEVISSQQSAIIRYYGGV